MGLSNLFKSKSKTGKLKPDPRIRWFGKLPTYPDYYKSQTEQPWTAEFNDWVLKGFEVYRSRVLGAGRLDHRLPISGCILRLPQSGMTVFASLLDFGGDMRGRPFPMCFYVGFPTGQWPGPTRDRLSGATRVVGDLTALRRDVARFINSPGHIESVFGNREVDLSNLDEPTASGSWVAAARSVTVSEWFAAAKDGLKVQDETTWLRAAAAWGDTLAQHEGEGFEPTLRLPLAKHVSLEAQVAGWIRWLESRMDLKRRSLSLMVSGDLDSQTGGLTVIARAPVPEDFVLLTPLANTLPYLDDLSVAEDAGGPGGAEAGPAGSGAEATDGGTGGSATLGDAGGAGKWIDFVESPAMVS